MPITNAASRGTTNAKRRVIAAVDRNVTILDTATSTNHRCTRTHPVSVTMPASSRRISHCGTAVWSMNPVDRVTVPKGTSVQATGGTPNVQSIIT